MPVIVGIGAQSEGMPISEMSRALASALDVDPVTFPGDHTGFEQDPQTFAQTLHQSLSAN